MVNDFGKPRYHLQTHKEMEETQVEVYFIRKIQHAERNDIKKMAATGQKLRTLKLIA